MMVSHANALKSCAVTKSVLPGCVRHPQKFMKETVYSIEAAVPRALFLIDDGRHACASMARMMLRVGMLLAVLVGAGGQELPATVAGQLDGREKQLESLYADYWRTEYKIALGDHALSSRPIQEQIRTVVSDERFLSNLRNAKISDSLLKTRQNLYLNEAVYTKITNDPALTAVVEQITQNENGFRFKVGDRQLSRAEVTDLLEHNPDRQLREEAWRATSQITGVNGARIQKAIQLRNQLAVKNSDEIFSIFLLHRKGLEVEQVFDWFDQIKEQTEPEYQRLLKRMRNELGVAKIEPWDLDFFFSKATNDFEAQKFPTDDGWKKTKELAASLGYDLDPVEMHVADLGFGGAAYPILYGKEVKILANRYSGIFFYDRLWHATGHALHYQMVNEPSFLLRANYAEPMDEGMAQVMALLLYRSEVNAKLFTLTPEQASVVDAAYRLKLLYTVRNTIADSLSEFESYSDPEKDPASVYNRIHAEYLGVDMHDAPVWGFNPMYGSDPIYLQSFVVGEMVARQIEHKVDEKFGRNWGKPAGDYLRTNFYSRGAEQSVDGFMRGGTGEALTPRYLVQFLESSKN